MASLPQDEPLGGAGLAKQAGGRAGDWAGFCEAIRWVRSGDDDSARRTIAAWLQPYAVGSGHSFAAHFTGYFEPVVSGSLTRDGIYTVPVYRRPDDLVTSTTGSGQGSTGRAVDGRLVPYWDPRADRSRSPVRTFACDLLAAKSGGSFLLCSCRASDGYACAADRSSDLAMQGATARPLWPIGRLLVEQDQIAPAAVNLRTIRAWLLSHPDQARSLMEQNPSYVFFLLAGNLRLDQGPVGALGIALLPLRSIAVDARFLPLAVPLWVDTEMPAAGEDTERLRRLMLAQDFGAGIDGPTRADIFFGWGEAAQERAGLMHAVGSMVALLPRPPARR